MLRQAEESDNTTRAREIRQALTDIHDLATKDWNKLTKKYGALEDLYSTMQPWPGQLPSATIVPTTSGALPMTIGPPVSVPPTTVPPPESIEFPRPGIPHRPGGWVPRSPNRPAGSSIRPVFPVRPLRPVSPGLPSPKPAPKPAISGAGGSTRPPPSPAPRPRNRLPSRPSSRPRSPGRPRSGCNRPTRCRCRPPSP